MQSTGSRRCNYPIIMKKFNRYGIYDKNCDSPLGEYEVWGSVFLILALPYFQVKYGAMEVVPWLQIKEASDAIRKDVTAILSTSLIINGNNINPL